MRAGRLSESPGRAARRSVRVRGETGGADGAEGASGAATPCTAMTAGPSAPASAAPLSLCYAPRPSTVREEEAQRRVRERSRRKKAQQMGRGAADNPAPPPRIRGSFDRGRGLAGGVPAPPADPEVLLARRAHSLKKRRPRVTRANCCRNILNSYMNKPPGVFLPGSSRRRPDPMGPPRGEMGGARRPEPETDRTEFSPWRDG